MLQFCFVKLMKEQYIKIWLYFQESISHYILLLSSPTLVSLHIYRYKCPKCRLPFCSVTCCKTHKLQCPNSTVKSSNDGTTPTDICSKDANNSKEQNGLVQIISNYLPSDALTTDPLENAIRRRNMLDEDDDEDEGYRINKGMMDKLVESNWLKQELKDGGLRQMISTIDSADNVVDIQNQNYRKRKQNSISGNKKVLSKRERTLETAKYTNLKFNKFIDRLLLTAGVLIKDDVNNDSKKNDMTNITTTNGEQQNSIEGLTLAPINKEMPAISSLPINTEHKSSSDSSSRSDSSISD